MYYDIDCRYQGNVLNKQGAIATKQLGLRLPRVATEKRRVVGGLCMEFLGFKLSDVSLSMETVCMLDKKGTACLEHLQMIDEFMMIRSLHVCVNIVILPSDTGARMCIKIDLHRIYSCICTTVPCID